MTNPQFLTAIALIAAIVIAETVFWLIGHRWQPVIALWRLMPRI